MRMYANSSFSLECNKVIVDTDDPDFVAVRFYQGHNSVHTVYLSPRDGKRLEWLRSIDAHDKTILVEETDADAN